MDCGVSSALPCSVRQVLLLYKYTVYIYDENQKPIRCGKLNVASYTLLIITITISDRLFGSGSDRMSKNSYIRLRPII